MVTYIYFTGRKPAPEDMHAEDIANVLRDDIAPTELVEWSFVQTPDNPEPGKWFMIRRGATMDFWKDVVRQYIGGTFPDHVFKEYEALERAEFRYRNQPLKALETREAFIVLQLPNPPSGADKTPQRWQRLTIEKRYLMAYNTPIIDVED